MIVRKQKQSFDFPFCDNLPNELHPTSQVVRPVDDGLVPRRGPHFDFFSVAKPSDVAEIGRYQVEWFLQFPRSRHERGVCQG
jgi:hypothetical protein